MTYLLDDQLLKENFDKCWFCGLGLCWFMRRRCVENFVQENVSRTLFGDAVSESCVGDNCFRMLVGDGNVILLDSDFMPSGLSTFDGIIIKPIASILHVYLARQQLIQK